MTRPAYLIRCARPLAALALAALAGCGGGTSDPASSGQSGKTPVIAGVAPDYSALGVATTFNVTGQNLPLTASATIGDQACATPTNRTATSFTVVCTPGGQFGNQVLVVRTDTVASGGWWIGQQTVWVSATTPNPAKTPIVSSVTPAAAALNTAMTFVVTGLDFPSTVSATLGNVNCLPPTNLTPSSFNVTCTPAGAPGNQMLTIRTDIESKNGWWIGQQSVWVAGEPAPGTVNTPVVSTVNPAVAVLGLPTTFIVAGQYLPLTAAATIGDVGCATPINRTASGFSVECTPGGLAGNQILTIRTDTLSNGGWWIGQQMVVVSAR